MSSKSFIKRNARIENRIADKPKKTIDRLDSLRGTDSTKEETFGSLSNVRFAVFGLGSSAYPNFCAFGKYVDQLLGELGGERLTPLATGDEMCGQEQAFHKWAPAVFKTACETFCLDTDDSIPDMSVDTWTVDTLRFNEKDLQVQPLEKTLETYHHRTTMMGTLKCLPSGLQESNVPEERHTILVQVKLPGVSHIKESHFDRVLS